MNLHFSITLSLTTLNKNKKINKEGKKENNSGTYTEM
jgi:hypothetical protein